MTRPPGLAGKSDSPFGKSSATPKQDCCDVLPRYKWDRDSNVDGQATVTPGPKTCRVTNK